jgi:hypothetical protein
MAENERLEDLPSQWPSNQAGVTILVSEKLDFRGDGFQDSG